MDRSSQIETDYDWIIEESLKREREIEKGFQEAQELFETIKISSWEDIPQEIHAGFDSDDDHVISTIYWDKYYLEDIEEQNEDASSDEWKKVLLEYIENQIDIMENVAIEAINKEHNIQDEFNLRRAFFIEATKRGWNRTYSSSSEYYSKEGTDAQIRVSDHPVSSMYDRQELFIISVGHEDPEAYAWLKDIDQIDGIFENIDKFALKFKSEEDDEDNESYKSSRRHIRSNASSIL